MKIRSPFSLKASFEPCPYLTNEKEQKKLEDLFNDSVIKTLTTQDKIAKQITLLNYSIHEIELDLHASNNRIEKLEGGIATKLPFIGLLIKLIFKCFNKKIIEQEKFQYKQLENKKNQNKEEIAALQESIPQNIQQGLLENLFNLEYQMRMALKENIPNKKKYLAIFEEKIIPLLNQTKAEIKQRPHQFAIHAAAAKGKAAQASFAALKHLAENKPIIKKDKSSNPQVFLLPNEGAVFKHSHPKAKEEEAIANALLDLMSKQAIVGSFNIRRASVEKLGLQISLENHERGFTLEKLSPSLHTGIKKKLSHQDLLILQKHEKSPLTIDANLKNYEEIRKLSWYVRIPGENWKLQTFQELQKLYLHHQLDSLTLIGVTQKTAISLQNHFLSNNGIETDFARALCYFPTLQTPPQSILLSPDLSDPDAKKSYQLCERHKWSYVDESNDTQYVDFKTLHSLFLQNQSMTNIQVVSDTILPPTTAQINEALNVQWKTISPQIMQIESDSISELNNIEAKPFIEEMILIKDLKPNLREVILDRLTPDAEFNGVLTGEVQLLDLHHNNLGMIPETNTDYDYFKKHLFTLPSGLSDFKQLLIDYLDEKISLDTFIKYEDQGVMIEKPLKEMPELLRALNVRWQFVIFDTDLSLSEDNRLQLQTYTQTQEYKNKEGEVQFKTSKVELGHLIPLRSVLLELKWKDKPLSKATIQRLIHSEERDLRVKNWIKKKDAPIYKHLSLSERETVENYVAPFILKYNLSGPRKHNKNMAGETLKRDEDVTIKSLRAHFIQEICDPMNHAKLWETLEQAFSFVIVSADDTWETLAKRHHHTVDDLKKMNVGHLVSGKKIKIQYDLTSSLPSVVEKRRRIACQLFPRMTSRQQTALLERQKNRSIYLNNYTELGKTMLKGMELLSLLKLFIKNESTPLSSLRKEEFLNDLNDEASLLNSPKDLLALKEKICEECHPSYFNLMKAMYPLLADAYALNCAVYKQETIAGQNIGLYREALEKTIHCAKEMFPLNSVHFYLALSLENQIASIKDPAFFGHWR